MNTHPNDEKPYSEEVAIALAEVNDAANRERHAGNYKAANALVRARVTLYKALRTASRGDDLEARAKAMFEAQSDKIDVPWEWQWDRAKQHWREKAAAYIKATEDTCTCPSGDGSLRWPCPQHPPESASQPATPASASEAVIGMLNELRLKWVKSVDGKPSARKIETVAQISGLTMRGDDDYDNEAWAIRNCARELDEVIAKLATLHQPPSGEPDIALLISMATCLYHGFGLLPPARQDSMLRDMRKLWDEVMGRGYYSPANRDRYTAMLEAAAPSADG